MKEQGRLSPGARFLLVGASAVVLIAGMRAASSLVVPFLLAVFISIICLPPLVWLQRKGVSRGLAVTLILAAIVVAILLLGTVVGTSINAFTDQLPVYQERLSGKSEVVLSRLAEWGIDVSTDAWRRQFNPGTVMQLIGNTLNGMRGALTNTFMILLTVIFILLEAASFPRKLRAALPDAESSLRKFASIAESVNRYLAIKSLFSLLTGLLVFAGLLFLGLDFPILWGLLAFILNFIPNIGSVIAAVPPVLLAIVQLGVGPAVVTVLLFLAANVLFGSILEPRFMGRGLGLSTLVVFLSLVFWGWVLGPIGMILSVPLTMIVKVALESDPDTRWIAVMLGSDPTSTGTRGATNP